MTIAATIARDNNRLYCVLADGTLLCTSAKNTLIAGQVAVNHHKADITPRQKDMLDYAIKVCLDSQAVADADHAALRVHGFDDEDIWDIAANTAFFEMPNRTANMISMRPNAEFYLMCRISK